MVRNEENYIVQVLRPLARVFGTVLLADTGSSDQTVPLAMAIPGVRIEQYGELTTSGITLCRQDMCDMARRMGYDWVLQVDGDELYTDDTLNDILTQGMPKGKRAGFIAMVSVEKDETGQWWAMQDRFSRLAVLPSDVIWSSAYPFESPDVFGNPSWFHYFDCSDGRAVHALHLHRMLRSSKDEEVALRKFKQFRYSMQEKPIGRDYPLDAVYWGLE